MVDEFQDSNNNQDLIFKLLSKDGTAEKYGNNLFAVGDVKQCIYRFINELATVRDHIFQTVHLPNVPRYDFSKIKKIFDNWA